MDCMKKECIRRGPWLEEEDEKLVKFVTLLGERRWDSLARVSGLKRSGKSCRLRWMNYLHPSLKDGPMSKDEELIILHFHALWGNKWAKIARRLPGRTDNEVKNYWRTHFRKKEQPQIYNKIAPRRLDACAGEISMTRKSDHEHVLKKNQTSLEDDQETYGGICERESLCVMNSPYETRISDWIADISTDQSEANLVEDHSCSNNDQNINIASWWFQETRDFVEFSSTLWS